MEERRLLATGNAGVSPDSESGEGWRVSEKRLRLPMSNPDSPTYQLLWLL